MNFIYENNTSLCEELCNEIIELFEDEEESHYLGITGGGFNPNVKRTIDFSLKNFFDNGNNVLKHVGKWEKIIYFLEKELSKNIRKYLSDLNTKYDTKFFNDTQFDTKGFLLHKYYKNDGKFEYHNDFSIENGKHRVIVYLWYLNDVFEGGETEIFDNVFVKPEMGKLLLFPALWYYKHKGHIPISNNKYVITGWFYSNNKGIK
jgi:hypothetical protein